MSVTEIIEECRTRRVELAAAGDRLRVRAPVGAVDDDLRARLRALKPELISLLVSACPGCGRPTDAKRRCWVCHSRACEACGRATGSAFLATCLVCDLAGGAGS